ncbi:hypothetical protein [Kingella negevensis]|uniref:hypothetical protein n=1 Tax=Kingella negevensis TaxID=1522312 RepID=UPI00050A086D|nr:hypothetical protein [Kingella negevensis]MDK4689578.1 hypothetical protein [Kingella negevensis]WII90424.1 hypothetical protein QEO93_08130 [Kingella negevensis]
MDKLAIVPFAKLFQEQQERCITKSESEEATNAMLLAVAQSGFAVASHGNQMMMGEHGLRAGGEATFPANQAQDFATWTREVPTMMRYQTKVEVDKGFVFAMMDFVTKIKGQPVDNETK